MIRGTVTPFREAVITIRLKGAAGQELDVEAAIDTGFDRYLTLPAALVTQLGLPFATTTSAILADGQLVRLSYYDGTVVWDGRDRDIPILAAGGGPLVGMGLLYGHDLRIQVVDGGDVIVEQLP